MIDKDQQYIVDLTAKRCDCKRWQLTGILYSHAISCLRHERINPESMVPYWYTLDAFKAVYAYNIMHVRDQSMWEKINGCNVDPLVYVKKVGRPIKSRRKQPIELEGSTRLSKHGVVIHCGYCQGTSHNRNNCELRGTTKKRTTKWSRSSQEDVIAT